MIRALFLCAALALASGTIPIAALADAADEQGILLPRHSIHGSHDAALWRAKLRPPVRATRALRSAPNRIGSLVSDSSIFLKTRIAKPRAPISATRALLGDAGGVGSLGSNTVLLKGGMLASIMAKAKGSPVTALAVPTEHTGRPVTLDDTVDGGNDDGGDGGGEWAWWFSFQNSPYFVPVLIILGIVVLGGCCALWWCYRARRRLRELEAAAAVADDGVASVAGAQGETIDVIIASAPDGAQAPPKCGCGGASAAAGVGRPKCGCGLAKGASDLPSGPPKCGCGGSAAAGGRAKCGCGLSKGGASPALAAGSASGTPKCGCGAAKGSKCGCAFAKGATTNRASTGSSSSSPGIVSVKGGLESYAARSLGESIAIDGPLADPSA
jgi:hypothetical protein